MKRYKIQLLLLAILLVASSCFNETKGQKRPNVIFIAIDDLNDYTGFLGGHPQAYTPNMDKLAASGVVFTNHFVSTSECNPSRTALLTGYHPKSTGLANNFLDRNTDYYDFTNNENTNKTYSRSQYLTPVVDKQLMTMPRYFKEVLNYNTVGCGKIFHHHSGDSVRSSFWNTWRTDYINDGLSGNQKSPGKSGIYFPPTQWLDWGVSDEVKEETFDYDNARWAAEQLTMQDKSKPFFLAFGIKKPHDPFYAPHEFFDLIPNEVASPVIYDNGETDNDWSDLPYKGKLMADKKDNENVDNDYEIIKRNNKINEVTRAYLATVAYADACVGVVLDALEKSPFAENTIVVLWSDHGWHLGEKMHYHKFTLWDESMRSPLIIRAPGGLKQRNNELVTATDLFPTLIDLCGGDPENYLTEGFAKQGNSLKPLLYNEGAQWNMPALTSCYKRFPPVRTPITDEFMAHGIRVKNWKFIEYYPDPTKPKENQFENELYYLPDDVNETKNLANKIEYLQIQQKLHALIHKYPGGEDGEKKENQTPMVIIDYPLNNMQFHLGDTIQLEANAYDVDSPTDIQKLELYIDGKKYNTCNSSATIQLLPKLTTGAHKLKIVAYDMKKTLDEHEVSIMLIE